MDLRFDLEDMYKSGYGLPLGSLHLIHRFLDMGQYIFDLHKLCLVDIRHSLHILVYKLVVNQYIQVHKSKRLDH